MVSLDLNAVATRGETWALPLRLVSGLFKTPRSLLSVSAACPLETGEGVWHDTNLVDPASSHMLVSKIKPCMSQYKLLHGETANGSLKQLSFIWW